MLVLYILIVWITPTTSKYQFNMYNINNRYNQHCLKSHYRYFWTGHINTFSYCLRQSDEINLFLDFNSKDSLGRIFTFVELREQHITSQMLLSWSASIDITERYQIFLNNDTNSSSTGEQLFHNCTPPWFGLFCRFTFDYSMDKTFDDIVSSIFQYKGKINKGTKVTCYEHLHCQTLLPCLDWREICDGKHDCLDGSDEENCW